MNNPSAMVPTGRGTAMGVHANELARAKRGRTAAGATPVFVRNGVLGESVDRQWLYEILGCKLGKFAIHVDRTDVFVHDESGPTGAPVISATIQLHVPRGAFIAVTARGNSARAALSAAVRSAERTLRRQLQRVRQARGHLSPLRPA